VANTVGVGVRITLTAILMVLVWEHAHWTVALALTLLSAANELHSYTIHLLWKVLKQRLGIASNG
jgi:hypothetical protein